MKLPRISLFRLVILAGVTVSIYAFLFKVFDLQAVDIVSLRVAPFLAALGVSLLFFPLSASRWYYILHGVEIDVSYWRVFSIVLATGPLGLVPGRLGDFVRGAGLPSETPRKIAYGSIAFEKALDVCALLFLATIGFLWLGRWPYGLAIAGGLIVLTAVGMLTGRKYFPIPSIKFLMPAIASSLLNWTLSVVQVYFLFRATGAIVSWTDIVAYLPIAIFIGLIPITIAGMGTRDSALIRFFASQASASSALTVGVWYTLLSYGLALMIGLPFLFWFLKQPTRAPSAYPTESQES